MARRGKRFGRHSKSSGGIKPEQVALGGLVYGAGRQQLAGFVAPLLSSIPMGGYGLNIAFGAAGYYLAKKTSGTMRGVGLAMLAVEAANVGAKASSGISIGAGTQSAQVYN